MTFPGEWRLKLLTPQEEIQLAARIKKATKGRASR